MAKKKKMEKNTAEGLANLVPQVFYDLIARIIPGGIIIIALYISYCGNMEDCYFNVLDFFNENTPPSSFVLLLFWLIVSYGIAIILWRQFDWIIMLFEKLSAKKFYSTIQNLDSYFYDFIKTRDSAAGSRITKLRAEKHMTEVLLTGFIYCLVVDFVLLFIDSDNFETRIILLAVLLICAISAFRTRRYFCQRSSVMLNNYYLLCGGSSNVDDIYQKITDLESNFDEIRKNRKH
jgi:hypothetical protein